MFINECKTDIIYEHRGKFLQREASKPGLQNLPCDESISLTFTALHNRLTTNATVQEFYLSNFFSPLIHATFFFI